MLGIARTRQAVLFRIGPGLAPQISICRPRRSTLKKPLCKAEDHVRPKPRSLQSMVCTDHLPSRIKAGTELNRWQSKGCTDPCWQSCEAHPCSAALPSVPKDLTSLTSRKQETQFFGSWRTCLRVFLEHFAPGT